MRDYNVYGYTGRILEDKISSSNSVITTEKFCF
jgi:hypothetical protein